MTRRDITRLVTFTNQCQCFMLGIDKFKQQLEQITSNDIRHKLDNLETAEDSLMAQRLRWLGHLECMEDHCLPKQLLHVWLPSTRPAYGVRLRWKDRIVKNLKMVGLTSTWFQLTQDRQKWKNVCASKINSIVTSRVELANTQSSQKVRDRADPSRCQDQQPLLCTTCKQLFKSQTGKKDMIATEDKIAQIPGNKQRPESSATDAVVYSHERVTRKDINVINVFRFVTYLPDSDFFFPTLFTFCHHPCEWAVEG